MSNEFVIKKGLLVQGGQNQITGSLTVSGSISATAITASLYGTASYTISSSWASSSLTASYWDSGSINSWTSNNFQFKIATGSTLPITSSQALTASYALNAGSAFGLATGSTYPITASQSISSSWSRITDIGNPNIDYAPLFNASLIGTNGGGTSLFAFNTATGSFRATLFLGPLTGSSYGTASFANSASYALTASTWQYLHTMHPKAGWTVTDNTTAYYGWYDDRTSVYNNAKMYIPFNGTLRQMVVKVLVTATLGSAELVHHEANINGIGSLMVSASWNTAFLTASASGSYSVSQGDWIALKIVTPTFVTDPGGVRVHATFGFTTP